MYVRVNKSRGDVPTLYINRCVPVIALTHPDNRGFTERDIGFVNLTGEDVDQIGIFQNNVSGRIAPRQGKQSLTLHIDVPRSHAHAFVELQPRHKPPPAWRYGEFAVLINDLASRQGHA